MLNSNHSTKPKLTISDWYWLFGLILVGCGMRLTYLIASHFIIDSDEAIVGLMAKHILETGIIPVFYYGQHYMGSLEAVTAAMLFKLFGLSDATLHFAPFFWFFASQIAFYALCKENFSSINARVAGLLYAIAPVGFIEWSTKARGGFIEIIFLITFAFLFLMRASRARYDKEASYNLFIASFILGVGWWVNNQVVYLFPFAGVLFLITLLPRGIRVFFSVTFLSALCFFFGGLPYWVYNIVHPGASFGMFHLARFSEMVSYFQGTFAQAIPIILGTRGFNQSQDMFWGSGVIADALFIFALLYALVATRIAALTITQRIFVIGCCVSSITVIIVFCISIFGSLSIAPRYLLPLYIFLLPLIALQYEQIKKGWKRYASITLFLVLALGSNYGGGMHISGQPIVYSGERVSRDHSELLTWLKEENISLIRTNYWIGYRIAFESAEAVRFVIFQPPREVRIHSYESLVTTERMRLETPLLVTQSQAVYLREALQTLGITFRETTKSGYLIFDHITLPWLDALAEVPQTAYTVSTALHTEEIPNMFDHDLHTRWASHKPQSPDMNFTITFHEQIPLRLIDLDVGEFKNDFPRVIRVLGRNDDGEFTPLYSDKAAKSIQYFIDSENDSGILLKPQAFKELRIEQTGKDPFFDWSIAELKLFR